MERGAFPVHNGPGGQVYVKGPDAGSDREVIDELRQRLALATRKVQEAGDRADRAERAERRANELLGAWVAEHAEWVSFGAALRAPKPEAAKPKAAKPKRGRR